MKKILMSSLLSAFILFSFTCSSTPDAPKIEEPLQAPSTQEQKTETSTSPLDRLTWPRFMEHKKGTLKIYQPQVEKWENEIVEYRMAIEILMKDRTEPVYGALWLKGATDTRLDERLVQIKNIQVSNISIPSNDPEYVKRVKEFINDTLKEKHIVISLDRILADVASLPEAISVKKTKTNMDPPNILVTQEPAVLLMIVDDPVLQPIADTGLSFVANANMDLFYYDDLKTYYLFIGKQWLSATDLEKGWKNNITPPDIFSKIPDDFERAYVKDLLGTKSEEKVIVLRAQPPAELILTEGPPVTVDIPGTDLMYVKNTEQNIFINKPEGLYYFMSSGRWFKSKRLKGPWVSAGNNLPADFSKIPDEHPKYSVLETVPGTPEAKEAVVESQIPRKITVKRKETTVDVKYHGDPEFRSLEGTRLAYAVNTTKDVFNFEKKYYCCYDGVWFISKEPDDSWEVCDTVPDEIYSIPATDPKYYVTYVHVYQYDKKTVTFGYTSGYTGTYVSEEGTVVQGTGHNYASYSYYYNGYPYYYWGPYTYWYWGYGYYYYGGPYYRYPYYGYTRYHHGRYGSGYTYHYGRQSLTRYSGSYKGVDFKTKQYRGPYGQWGKSEFTRGDDWVKTWHKSGGDRTIGGVETSGGGKGFVAKGDEHRGGIYKTGGNNLYVGVDGNLYRRDEDGWSKREDGDWNQIDRDKISSKDRPDTREGLKTKQDKLAKTDGAFQRSDKSSS
ncbi:MAG: hypothetical protein JRJ65_18050, partial [Deltaproteobacteria bacterium]|nr:hypothetical protein [Deltaproteobacteria bacterium]